MGHARAILALGDGALVAPLAARALAEGWSADIERAWCETHRRLIGRRYSWCWAFATLVRHPWLASGAVRVARMWPSLCQPIVRSLNRFPRIAPEIHP